MKCPACKKRLKPISPAQAGEYICNNSECPANQSDYVAYCEFYGTQKEIDVQWP